MDIYFSFGVATLILWLIETSKQLKRILDGKNLENENERLISMKMFYARERGLFPVVMFIAAIQTFFIGIFVLFLWPLFMVGYVHKERNKK